MKSYYLSFSLLFLFLAVFLFLNVSGAFLCEEARDQAKILTILILSLISYGFFPRNKGRPLLSTLISLIIAFFPLLGYLSILYVSSHGFDIDYNFSDAISIYLTFNLWFFLGINVFYRLPYFKTKHYYYPIIYNKFVFSLKILTVIWCLIAIIFFLSGGSIQLLEYETSRLNTLESVPGFIIQIYFTLSYILIILFGIHLLKNRRHYSLAMLSVLLILMFGSMARQFFIFPLVTLIFYSIFSKKNISYLKLMIVSFLVFIVFFSYLSIRSKQALTLESFANNVGMEIMPEFLSLAQVLENDPEGEIFPKSDVLNIIFMSAIPRQILSIFNLDKEGNYVNTGIKLAEHIGLNNVGIRVGIIGESFLYFGYFGVIFISLILSAIVSFIDTYTQTLNPNDSRIIILSFLSALVLFSTKGQLNSIFEMFWYPMYILLPILFFCSNGSKLETSN